MSLTHRFDRSLCLVPRSWLWTAAGVALGTLLGGLFGDVSRSSAAEPAAAAKPAAGVAEVDPQHAAKMAQGLAVFKAEVREILVERCLACHGGDATEAELDLATREGLVRGGKSGPVILLGQGQKSRLVKLVAHLQKPHMPQDEDRLPQPQIAALTRWIDLGAPYDGALVERPAEPAVDWTAKKLDDRARQQWAFSPLARTTPPQLADDAWCRTPIDRFILARLREEKLTPHPPADRRTLIRRAYFDLIGLPPPAEEVEKFVSDPDPRAYDRLVDRLLDSPHFGERWARHWLDVARFAESHGFEQDYDRPYAYHYRDYVIRALNADQPYDEFVRWQLAGDEIAPDNAEALMATGFLGAGVFPTQITANEVERTRYDALDDMAATMGTAMLGLTIGCARCHDHKFDPIPQADYYRLVSVFTTTVRSVIDVDLDPAAYRRAKEVFDREHAPLTAARAAYEKDELPAQLAAWETVGDRAATKPPANVTKILDKPAGERTADEAKVLIEWYRPLDPDWKKLNKAVEDHAAQTPPRTKVMVTSEGFTPLRHHTQGADFFNETFFLRRGDTEQKQGVAAPGYLQLLSCAPEGAAHWRVEPPAGWRTSYRRTSLARWIIDTEYGAGDLLARVAVNRLWQHHLGRGIVATANDFGSQGQPPTHPELLDWLADQLQAGDWKLKRLHRLIMTSAVYLQASTFDADRTRLDPENRLLWRRTPQRLEAEVLRDSLLAASGLLDRTMFGPGTLDEDHTRRSIYFMVKRSKLIPSMQLFDSPEPLVSIGERPSTTVAPQALYFMNNAQVRRCALEFAARLAADSMHSKSKEELAASIRRGYFAAVSREPSPAELRDCLTFVREQAQAYRDRNQPDADRLALADLCQVLLSLNEFVYVE